MIILDTLYRAYRDQEPVDFMGEKWRVVNAYDRKDGYEVEVDDDVYESFDLISEFEGGGNAFMMLSFFRR